MYSFETQSIKGLSSLKGQLIAQILLTARKYSIFLSEKLNKFSIDELVAFDDALEAHIKKQLQQVSTLKKKLTRKAKKTLPAPLPSKAKKVAPAKLDRVSRPVITLPAPLKPEKLKQRAADFIAENPPLPLEEIIITKEPIFDVISTSDPLDHVDRELITPAGPEDVQKLLKLARMAFASNNAYEVLSISDEAAEIFLS